ncbi:DNA polymerase zeta [Clydaea vesicula]|uniref:DNA polymerase zeta catalytic subunit n=1 Tax=Clydaea vesicula TaxID=447962 RepID=A0AAD5U0Z5_9FUNG|nr:DNA polymerase zeta [Clydaea vesicula]
MSTDHYHFVKLIHIDHHQVDNLPVIRVFGVDKTGISISLHVHDCLPYIYIPYDGEIDDFSNFAFVFVETLHLALEKLKLKEHVYIKNLVLVKGYEFYGFDRNVKLFIKIYYTNPSKKFAIVNLLQRGSILDKIFKVYDATFNLVQQFMIDFNLTGMNWVKIDNYSNPLLKLTTSVEDWECSVTNLRNIDEIKQRKNGLEVYEKKWIPSLSSIWESHGFNEKKVKSQIRPLNDMNDRLLERLKLKLNASKKFNNDFMSPDRQLPVKLLEDFEGVMTLFESLLVNAKPELMEEYPNSFVREVDEVALTQVVEQYSQGFENMLDVLDAIEKEKEFENMDIPDDNERINNQYNDDDDPNYEEDFDPESSAFFDTPHSTAKASRLRNIVNTPTNIKRNLAREFSQLTPNDSENVDAISEDENVEEVANTSNDHKYFFQISQNDGADDNDDEIWVKAQKESLKRKRRTEEEMMTPLSSKRRTKEKETEITKINKRLKYENDIKQEVNEHNQSYFTKSILQLWSPLPSMIHNQEKPMPSSPSLLKNKNLEDYQHFVKPRDSNLNSKISTLTSLSGTEDSPLGNTNTAESEAQQFTDKKKLIYQYPIIPPSQLDLDNTFKDFKLPSVIYKEPHFSNPKDKVKKRIYAGKEITIPVYSNGFKLDMKNEFNYKDISDSYKGLEYWRNMNRDGVSNLQSSSYFCYGKNPPKRSEVEKWCNENVASTSQKDISQVKFPTQRNFGQKFDKVEKNLTEVASDFLTILDIEVFVPTRADLNPDPKLDKIEAVVYCFYSKNSSNEASNIKNEKKLGVITVEKLNSFNKNGLHNGYQIYQVKSEVDLLMKLIELVYELNPDIMCGYEIHNSSWGYVIERGSILDLDVLAKFSKVLVNPITKFGRAQNPFFHDTFTSLYTSGRIFINIWRLMKTQLNLSSYTLENTVFQIVHQRIPHFSFQVLTNWYNRGYIKRVQLSIQLLEETNFISQTSEFSRMYGIDFTSVITRKSQFKVESILARLARPENYFLLSPSRDDVKGMRAPECISLVMEPESDFYNSPTLVMDFASLYPSVMIAFNYCFSTCLGKVDKVGERHKFGVLDDFSIPLEVVNELIDDVIVSPNGLIFCKPHIRKGVLPRMLEELLETRVLVKDSVKNFKTDLGMKRVLDARQLGLKLIANVTYGYTAASMTGKMPCVELADAIVQSSRVILETVRF